MFPYLGNTFPALHIHSSESLYLTFSVPFKVISCLAIHPSAQSSITHALTIFVALPRTPHCQTQQHFPHLLLKYSQQWPSSSLWKCFLGFPPVTLVAPFPSPLPAHSLLSNLPVCPFLLLLMPSFLPRLPPASYSTAPKKWPCYIQTGCGAQALRIQSSHRKERERHALPFRRHHGSCTYHFCFHYLELTQIYYIIKS